MKKFYTRPSYDEKKFQVEDVITTSGEGSATLDDGSDTSNWSQFLQNFLLNLKVG